MIYGYIRVSSDKQTVENQRFEISNFCEHQNYLVDGEERHTELIIDKPRTKNSIRDIPMTKDLLSMVKTLKKIVRDDYYVLTNETDPTEPRTYRVYFNGLIQELGLPKMRFHGLRHSFATRCIESKGDYKAVSVLPGYLNISTTLIICPS